MTTLFVDTNLFLQCKDIKSLKWEPLFPNSKLKILIPRAVQKEIDNFKGQGNTRRSKKAKAASTFFKEILNSPNGLDITSEVNISFPSRRELASTEREPSLDSNKNDDSIIQDILSYQKIYANESVCLLTNDSGLMVTAKEYGIEFIDIPDGWLLEPEPDDKDKKIINLEKRIKALETNFPEIKIQVNTIDEQNIHSIAYTFLEFPELTSIEIDKLVALIKQKNPMKINFDDSQKGSSIRFQELTSTRYTPPSESSIKEYTNTLYPEWEEKIREQLKSINTNIYFNNNIFSANLFVSNDGQVPAESLLLEICLSEPFNLYFEKDGDFISKDWKLPAAPEPPKGKFTIPYNSFSDLANSLIVPKIDTPRFGNLLSISTPHSIDKNSFYWKNKPPIFSQKWVKECEEFRHQMQPEVITLKFIPNLSQIPTGGKITCSVSARNLPNPVKC